MQCMCTKMTLDEWKQSADGALQRHISQMDVLLMWESKMNAFKAVVVSPAAGYKSFRDNSECYCRITAVSTASKMTQGLKKDNGGK